MREVPSERAIVRAVADEVALRLSRKVIRELQSQKDEMAGEDAGLTNVWEHICVQVQHEYSIFWDVYEDVALSITRSALDELEVHEIQAIWFQTDNGTDWLGREPEDRDETDDVREDVVEYILREYVFSQAGDWSNARIRAYLDRQY